MTTADFWKLYRIIGRRRWLIAAVIGCTMLVVGVGVLVMPRYYRATALVMPSDTALEKSVLAGSTAPASERGYNPEARGERLANLIYLAQSQAVLTRAAEAMSISEPVQKLARRVTVDTLPRTAILRIVTLDRDPSRSMGLANAIAHTFAEFYRELSHREAAANRVFLQRELASAERSLRGTQDALSRFRAAGAGASLDPTAAEPALSPLDKERDSAEAGLRETSARLAAVRSQLQRQAPTMVSEEGTTDNPALTKLRTDLYDLEGKLAAERAVHTDRHPTVVALQAQLDDLRRRLATEMERVIKHTTIARNPLHDKLATDVADLESQRAALQARVAALGGLASRERGQVASASSRGVTLAALTREYRIADETYARLKAAVDQARIDEKVSNDAGAIQIVDLAQNTEGPVTKGPSPLQLLGLGLVLSLGVAFGLAITLDLVDDRVKTTDDIMRVLRLPVTGVIPAMEGVRARDLPLITQVLPSSPYAEAYRFLRTDLLFTCEDQPLQSLCVVTPKPGQGGTTTIANLAIALAEADRRVILVDADLRRPSLHQVFDVPNEAGLTSVLAGGTALTEALQETSVPNLRLLTAGPPAHNPSNLISSNRMRSLMGELREHCDFVLFDTPSAIAFSDAAIIASMTDGALMVVRARQPLRGSQLQVSAMLNKARANVVGVVLNDAAPEDVDTCHFYSHYYSPQLPGVSAAPAALPPAHEEASTAGDAEEMTVAVAVEEQPGQGPVGAAAASGGGAPGTRRWKSGIFSALFIGVLGYLAAGGLGYAPLPHLGGGRGLSRLSAGKPGLYPPGTVHRGTVPRREGGQPSAPTLSAGEVRLVANVASPTLARVTADGRVLYDGVLVPGRNEWRAVKRITLWVQRPEAVQLEYNGKREKSTLGRAGDDPVERTFGPADGVPRAG